MSSVFVYNADSEEAATYYPPGSPFVPDNGFFGYSPSPNTVNFPLPPPSPYLQSGFIPTPSNVAGYQRDRRPSWSGAPTGNYLQLPQAPGMHRRSFSAGSAPQPVFMAWPPAAGPSSVFINPLLVANDLKFDLSLPEPSAMRYHLHNKSETPIPEAELSHFATNPPLTSVHIVCDKIPKWPIEVRRTTGVTVGDVLNAIHAQCQKGIANTDWNALSSNEQKEVNKAYLKRCRNAGTAEGVFKKQGVKVVDLLCEKIWFRGLAPEGSSPDKLRMYVV